MRVSKLILIVTLIIGLNKKINSQTYPNQNISLVSFYRRKIGSAQNIVFIVIVLSWEKLSALHMYLFKKILSNLFYKKSQGARSRSKILLCHWFVSVKWTKFWNNNNEKNSLYWHFWCKELALKCLVWFGATSFFLWFLN